MGLLNSYTLRMQITRLFEQGQSFFAAHRVETWLREHRFEPTEYEIQFHQEIAPPGTSAAMLIRIELRRRDGEPVDPWLLEEVNRQS